MLVSNIQCFISVSWIWFLFCWFKCRYFFEIVHPLQKEVQQKYIWKQQNCQLNRNSEYFPSSNEKFRWAVKISNKYSIQRFQETANWSFEFNNSIEHYVNTWNLSINYWICTIFCWKPISDVMHIEVQWNECASSLIYRQKMQMFFSLWLSPAPYISIAVQLHHNTHK